MWCSSDFTAKILVQRVLMLASGREKGGKRENRNGERICPKNKQIGFFFAINHHILGKMIVFFFLSLIFPVD